MPVRARSRDGLASLLEAMTVEDLLAFGDEFGDRMAPADRMLFERILGEKHAAGVRADPWTLAHHLDGDAVKDWRYTRLLAAKFRQAVTLESRFQVWNMPAQVGKSTWLQRGCVWALDRDPTLPLIYLAYGDTLAREAAIFVRDQAVTHADRLRFELRPDLKRQNRWKTSAGGGMLAASLGGSVSGFGARGVIIDDPLKNWQEAHSKNARDAAWNEIVAVARLRLAEGGFMILAHTRWHLDDPSGRMHALADELGVEVEFVTLPMRATADDPLGRTPGEVLEPQRYSVEEVESRSRFLGSYLTAALEQQDPQPEEGGEIKREWWRWFSDAPPSFSRCLTSWDMKLKDKEGGDYVVGLVVGRVGAVYYVTDMFRGQWNLRTTKLAIALASVRHPEASSHVIENTGNGPEVMEQLRRGEPSFEITDEDRSKLGGLAMTDAEAAQVQALMRGGLGALIPQNVKGDKLVRARTNSIPRIEAGEVWLPEGKSWPHVLVGEHAAFPPKSGGHDDTVDALSQALARLSTAAATTKAAPQQSIAKPKPSARATQNRGTIGRSSRR